MLSLGSTKTLNNGIKIPLLGLGVFRTSDEETVNAVKWALEAGYRHIDTAQYYANETGVGKGLRESGVPREEIFVTTKAWNDDMRAGGTMRVFEASLKAMQLDYVDLYLIHWPVEKFEEIWKVFEEIYASGRAKCIGVSNFQPHHLEKLLKSATVKPAVNQIEIHPRLTQKPLIDFCGKQGIACEAWSPLGGLVSQVRQEETLESIGKKHGKSAVQVILRWQLQRGVIPLPKSSNKDRIVENTRLYDFELDADEMAAIEALNQDKRVGPDPDNFTF